jgi:hypothetical protein
VKGENLMVSEYLRELMKDIDLTRGEVRRWGIGMAHIQRRNALEDRLRFEIQGILHTVMEYGDWHSMTEMILNDIEEEERNEREELTNA